MTFKVFLFPTIVVIVVNVVIVVVIKSTVVVETVCFVVTQHFVAIVMNVCRLTKRSSGGWREGQNSAHVDKQITDSCNTLFIKLYFQ